MLPVIDAASIAGPESVSMGCGVAVCVGCCSILPGVLAARISLWGHL